MTTKKRPQNWTAERKMEAVIAYKGMNEQEQGSYLRANGLHSVDLDRWCAEILLALSKKPNKRDPKDRRIREGLSSALRAFLSRPVEFARPHTPSRSTYLSLARNKSVPPRA